MGFFKDIKGTITGTINGSIPNGKENLLEKTGELAKCNKQIADSKKRMMILFQNIGMKYYAECPELQDPQYIEWFGYLDQEHELIAMAEDRIRELKGLALCPSCGAEVPIGAAFCTVCGNQMPVRFVPQQKICPACGMSVMEEALFCTNCGCSLKAADNLGEGPYPDQAGGADPGVDAPIYPEPEQPMPQTSEPVPVQEAVQKPANVCKVCGSSLRENAAFCTMCGTKIVSAADSEEAARQAFYRQVDQPVQTAENLWDRSSVSQSPKLVLDGIAREEKKPDLKDYRPELQLDGCEPEAEEKPQGVNLQLDEM